jgi:hypothetical protein
MESSEGQAVILIPNTGHAVRNIDQFALQPHGYLLLTAADATGALDILSGKVAATEEVEALRVPFPPKPFTAATLRKTARQVLQDEAPFSS